MHLSVLAVEGFRNLTPQRLSVPPGITLVIGGNGEGKTNLLEAVAVLGNLVSFRTASPRNLVRRGAARFRLLGEVERGGARLVLEHGLELAARPVRSLLRGSRRLTASEYLGQLPVVALSGGDRELLSGGPELRRRFLDRLAYERSPDGLAAMQRYRRALRQRNVLLGRGAADRELDPFERELAASGARVLQLRLATLAVLEPALAAELEVLGWSLSMPVLRYHCPDQSAPADPATMAKRLRDGLLRSRHRERQIGYTVVGPHRHDLGLTIQGAAAREVLSAGQGKLLVTALRLAAARVVEQERGFRPVTVYDDVDAELDAEVLRRVLTRLADGRQALLSTPHQESVRIEGVPITRWQVCCGAVTVR